MWITATTAVSAKVTRRAAEKQQINNTYKSKLAGTLIFFKGSCSGKLKSFLNEGVSVFQSFVRYFLIGIIKESA